MNVVITCAGTGGHINPGIAIAQIIKKRNPDANILFIGTKTGLENELITKAGFPIETIRTGKLLRKLTVKNIIAMFHVYAGIGDTKKILTSFEATLVIGTGGYICGPVMLAARKLGIPYMLHESNAYPGLATKMLAKKSACTMLGFKEAMTRLKGIPHLVYTGTPSNITEKGMALLKKNVCRNKLKLEVEDKKIVLVTFGSQGAKYLNTTILDMITNKLDNKILYVLVTGTKNYEQVQEKVQEKEKELGMSLDDYLYLQPFVYEMDKMYEACDMCITRAGAMTITELAIVKKPSILIPLPYATENHQLYNASVLGEIGAAIVIEEKNLDIDDLYEKVSQMVTDHTHYQQMINAFDKLEKKDVEEAIYTEIKAVLK